MGGRQEGIKEARRKKRRKEERREGRKEGRQAGGLFPPRKLPVKENETAQSGVELSEGVRPPRSPQSSEPGEAARMVLSPRGYCLLPFVTKTHSINQIP